MRSKKAFGPLVIATVALLASVVAEAALPAFPADSLAPLYGGWRNAMGRDPAPMSIGPKWMTSVAGQCPQRARYKVLTVEPVTVENETELEVTIHTYGEEFVGKKARETCSARQLQRGGDVRFHFIDREEPADAPISVWSWDACDTLDHSIMERVSKHHLVHSHK